MKKLVLLTLLGAFFLGGCAATTHHKNMKVKCPACGYEFEVPTPPTP